MRDTQPPRRRLQRLRHDLGVVDPARPARTFRVLETLKTISLIAGPTRDHRLSGDTDPVRNLGWAIPTTGMWAPRPWCGGQHQSYDGRRPPRDRPPPSGAGWPSPETAEPRRA